MKLRDIVYHRSLRQQLTSPACTAPTDVVTWMGAVQAQDYGAAKWALGMRCRDGNDMQVDEAFNSGKILRTHVLRPTWHFVSPHDIRWMIDFSAPRVNAFNAYYYRKTELDAATFSKSNKVLTRILRNGNQLTREDIQTAYAKAKIATNDLRFTLLMIRAELDKVVCSGARQGKQFTYALLDERAPLARALSHDEALHQLTRRYFQSRGPATVHDFAWWGGLTTAEAAKGIDIHHPALHKETIAGNTYWFDDQNIASPSGLAHLLPNFDEYHISYTDRSASVASTVTTKTSKGLDGILGYVILFNGQTIGTWKRTLRKSGVQVEAIPFKAFSATQQKAIRIAAKKYASFLNLNLLDLEIH